MNNLNKLIASRFIDILIDGIKLQCKVMSFEEALQFEKTAESLGVSESGGQFESIKAICIDLLHRFIYEDGQPTCKTKEDAEKVIAQMPIRTCIELMNAVIESNKPDSKKK